MAGNKAVESDKLLFTRSLRAIGHFVQGKMVGDWTWYHENGTPLQTGRFDEQGQKTGLWKRYHANGVLLDEGEFREGRQVRVWKTYNVHGELLKSTLYKP